MHIRNYLRQQGLTYREMGEKIGVTPKTVHRYAEEGRVPEPQIMRRIVLATGGQVRPNDFYQIEDEAR